MLGKCSTCHVVWCSVQSGLVCAFCGFLSGLVDVGVVEGKGRWKEGSEGAVCFGSSRVVCFGFDGDFCDFDESVDLCSSELACDVVADVFCCDTFRLSIAQTRGRVLFQEYAG